MTEYSERPDVLKQRIAELERKVEQLFKNTDHLKKSVSILANILKEIANK